MAPKKKAAKKGAGDDDGPDQGEMNMILEAQVDSLKQRLVLEQERSNIAHRKISACREEDEGIEKEKEEEAIKTRQLIKGMTSMYREMENGLQGKIKS